MSSELRNRKQQIDNERKKSYLDTAYKALNQTNAGGASSVIKTQSSNPDVAAAVANMSQKN